MGERTIVDLEQDLGRRLRRVRIAAGLSQDELARAANLSRGAIRTLETGAGSTVSTLLKVVRVLDRTDWLRELEPPVAAFNPLDLLDPPSRPHPGPPRVRRRGRHTPSA